MAFSEQLQVTTQSFALLTKKLVEKDLRTSCAHCLA
jgi:hypothetical protein